MPEACKNRPVPPEYGPTPAEITPEALRSWVSFEDEQLLAINKPGWVVCHPAKRGPRSALVSAVKEDWGLEQVHLVHRLDRETTGLVLLAKESRTASVVHKALQDRMIRKTYLALLEGELNRAVTVEEPIGPDRDSPVAVKQRVKRRGPPSITHFRPLLARGGFSLASVGLETGRKHQIRVHAQWLEHSVVGDKLYGPNESLYLAFTKEGWTSAHAECLPLFHHGLHAWRLELPAGLLGAHPEPLQLQASPDEEWMTFCRDVMGLSLSDLNALLENYATPD